MDGIVYDLQGNPIDTTDDLERVFLDHLQIELTKQPCFVVTGGTQPNFDERCRQLGAVVLVDQGVGDAVLIVDGQPDEWQETVS